MPEHPYGWLSLLPPVAAIALAIASRRVVISLGVGIAVGGLVMAYHHSLLAGMTITIQQAGVNLISLEHLQVFAFTLMMGAMVGLIQRSGGMHGVIDKLSPLARGRRSGQITIWLLGLIVFFDDYANTLLLGGTMRAMADRLKISREKLAYLVDSTAAPVAGLAIVSTWVAGEIGFINDGLKDLPSLAGPADGFTLFIASIPYRFYVLLALAFVALVAVTGRDFGPMLWSERSAGAGKGKAYERAFAPATPSRPWRWHNAVVPVIVMIAGTFGVLIYTGMVSVPAGRETSLGWLSYIGYGDSYRSLVCGSAAGLVTAAGWIGAQRIMPSRELILAVLAGARQMLIALLILWLAWTLSSLTSEENLGTGSFLAGMIGDRLPAALLPTVTFVLASAVAFATGTSWGTMGILMSLVIRVAVQVLSGSTGQASANDSILIAVVGSVLAGAIFGDHCSPISDTTVLSSLSSGCDHVQHVRTQLPYALLVAGVSIACGTLPAGFGVPNWLLIPLGLVCLVILLRLIGRRAVDSHDDFGSQFDKNLDGDIGGCIGGEGQAEITSG